MNQLVTKKETEQLNLTGWLADLRRVAQKFNDPELSGKLRQVTSSVNRAFCLFDEFEGLLEQSNEDTVQAPSEQPTPKIDASTQVDLTTKETLNDESVIDWKTVVEQPHTETEEEIVQINFNTKPPQPETQQQQSRKLSVESLSSSPANSDIVQKSSEASDQLLCSSSPVPDKPEPRRSSRRSSRSTSPACSEASVEKFKKILEATQKNAIEAKKLIDEVKEMDKKTDQQKNQEWF